MKKKIFISLLIAFLSGCNTMPIINIANETTCVTEIAKKSNIKCEIEGKKVFAKK